jgi:hypothetical protein
MYCANMKILVIIFNLCFRSKPEDGRLVLPQKVRTASRSIILMPYTIQKVHKFDDLDMIQYRSLPDHFFHFTTLPSPLGSSTLFL